MSWYINDLSDTLKDYWFDKSKHNNSSDPTSDPVSDRRRAFLGAVAAGQVDVDRVLGEIVRYLECVAEKVKAKGVTRRILAREAFEEEDEMRCVNIFLLLVDLNDERAGLDFLGRIQGDAYYFALSPFAGSEVAILYHDRYLAPLEESSE